MGPMKKLLSDIRQRVEEGAVFRLTPIGEIRELCSGDCPALVGANEQDYSSNEEAEDTLTDECGFNLKQASLFIEAADNYRVERPKTAALRRALLRACGLEEVK